MYQINIEREGEPLDVVQHSLCAEDISDVDMMLTSVVGKRLNIPNLVLMPVGNHKYLAFQVVGPLAMVQAVDIEGTD